MNKTNYYEITKNTDSCEGRGATVGTGVFFWRYTDALEFVKSDRYRKFGVMGSRGSEYDIKEHTTKLPSIFNNLEEYDEQNSQQYIREKALKKLTKAEKEALGLE